jgi:4-hydroxyphenylpyruvate dioxygenase
VALMDRVKREEPGIRIDVTDMPDRIAVEGVEFVEFAANETEAEELGALLSTMGFSLAAEHRNRDVAVWRQGKAGGINIVVNTSQEGFAHSSYLVHGTNAYALGLHVADAAATVARARALGAETFAEQRGAGELSIPAIRGVGGGVIYFIDDALADVWNVEFEPVEQVGSHEARLVGIDHVAQTMNYEEMLTWLLFYTAIFETSKQPMVDVVDPAGLVRSQVIESPDGRLRLTLNGAESRKTLAGHFVAESFGSSVQHIAFATDDILETAARLAKLGFRSLEISPNYYDDLEARFDLAPELVDRLRKANILYDRDEGGEFFQFYSRNFGEGSFFEIVERRDNYAGYGGPNAPFRIAAQKRAMLPKGMPKTL